MTETLRPTAFRGDPDVADLQAFFMPGHHFAGDTRWTFGTSLKSAYVNSFEFMNHAPIVQLWRDRDEIVQAVSRLSLGTAEWFHLATPGFRSAECTKAIIDQSDAALALLSDDSAWSTVCYQSKTAEIEQLERSGYHQLGVSEVYMTRSLIDPIEDLVCPPGIEIRLLDVNDQSMVEQRALAQVDAFSEGEPTAAETSWIRRSLPHQLDYATPDTNFSIVAVDSEGSVLAFADPFCDPQHRVGEFEPVGTRTSARRRGLGTLVVNRGLQQMCDNGMTQAIVRTGVDNEAARATYESAGFTTTDHLVRMTRQRPPTRATRI